LTVESSRLIATGISLNMAKQPGRPPGVHAKELQRVELLTLRGQYFRLDVGPFLFLYVTLLLFMAASAIQRQT